MKIDRILSLLGIARKSKALIIGFDDIKSLLSRGRRLLVFLAEDYSAKVRDKLYYYENTGRCKTIILKDVDRITLSHSIGAGNVQIVALKMNCGLSDKILQLVTQGGDAIE